LTIRPASLLAAGMALAALMLAPAAQASGPTGGGGGGGSSLSAVASVACTPAITLTNTTGYFRTYAAIWTNFSVTPCPTGGPGTWVLTYRNINTGRIDFRQTGSYLQTNSSFNNVVDDDFGPFATPYTVTLTVTDARGAQTSQSASVTTRAARLNG
jgi:hypothetical protein